MKTVKPGDGVIPGKYKVSVLVHDRPSGPVSTLIPAKYTDPEQSGLEITVDKAISNYEVKLEKP